TAPGISCTRASSGFQTPACFPFCFPLANLAAISNPPRRRPSRLIVTVIGYVCPAANDDGTPASVTEPPGALTGLSRWQRWHDCSPKPPVTFGYGPSLNADAPSGQPISISAAGITILFIWRTLCA